MANYQNQYGAVPISKNPIEKEEILDSPTQVIIADTTTPHNITTSTSTSTAGEEEITINHHHHNKKQGIVDKIKDKLPRIRTHHHH